MCASWIFTCWVSSESSEHEKSSATAPRLCKTRTAKSQFSVFCHWCFRHSCGFRAETYLLLCLFSLSFWSHLTLYHWKARESVAVLNPLWETRLPSTLPPPAEYMSGSLCVTREGSVMWKTGRDLVCVGECTAHWCSLMILPLSGSFQCHHVAGPPALLQPQPLCRHWISDTP